MNCAKTKLKKITTQFQPALAHALDVTSEKNWEVVIGEVLEKWERLDILVNNAGVSFAKPVTEMTLTEWRHVMAVNLDGVFLGTKYGIRAMQKIGEGSIINVSSASGLKASVGASKAAVRLFSKTAALECAQAGYNIRVNTIFPSGVMTPMWENMEFWQEPKTNAGNAEAAWQAISQDIPHATCG